MLDLATDDDRQSDLPRPRLEDLGLGLSRFRVTVVVAGAGYGKSTLLRKWADHSPAAIHTLTTADGEAATLARNLLGALRLRVPALARRQLAPIGVEGGDGSGTRSATLASELAQMLRVRTRPVVLMLDDVHEVEGTEGIELIEALIRQAPDSLRVLLAARQQPSIRLARLRGRGEVMELTAADLAFTREETGLMVSRWIPDAGSELVNEVFDITGGWPVAVRLAVEALGDAPATDRRILLERARRPGGTLFSYLAEEVIESEAASDRHLLQTLAVLGEASVDLCQGLGLDEAEKRLARLASRGIYFESSGDHYRLTPLVRGYLTEQSALAPDERAKVLVAASAWHETRGEWAAAVKRALDAGETELASRLINEHGDQVLTQGGARLVVATAEESSTEPTPTLLRVEGEARQALGDWDGALEVFQQLAGTSHLVDSGLAWRMGLIPHLRGEVTTALEHYQRGKLEGDPVDIALLLGWWASALWVTGRMEECRRLAAQAHAQANLARDDRALANSHTILAMIAALDGDRQGNEAHYLKALDHAERADDVLQRIRIHVNRSSRHVEESNYLEAIDEADLALQLAELGDVVSFRALALLNRGLAHFKLGRLEAAAADFEAARRQWDRLRSRNAAYAINRVGEIHRARGERAQARAAYTEAISVIGDTEDLQGLMPAWAGLARLLAEEAPDEAMAYARKGVEAGRTMGRVPALVAMGRVQLARGEVEAAAAAAEEAAALARTRRDRAGLAEVLELQGAMEDPGSARRLDEAESLWEEIGDQLGVARVQLARASRFGASAAELARIGSELQRLGARSLAAEARRMADEQELRSRPEVRIETLGGFAVQVNGSPVPVTAWQSRKARDALKMMVARRGRPIHREALMEQLWPGEDPAKTANRLSVALSVVRSVLDPERRHDQDHYLIADRLSVALATSKLDLDVEAFLETATRGLKNRERDQLERAESMYRGDFLEEDAYEDWSVALRDEVRNTYLQVARTLAELAEADNDHDASARYHLRLLERDPFDEPAHLGLVAAMARTGRYGEAHRLYRQYCARMAELDVEAAPFPAA